MATARTIAPSKFLLTLDGVACGFVQSVDGGGIAGDVIELREGGAPAATRKAIGAVRYENVTVALGLDLAHDVYDWIAASWNLNFVRKDGSVTVGDANLNAKTELHFGHVLPTAVTVSALDASAKQAVRLDVTMAPEVTTTKKGSGKLPAIGASTAQKKALASNFRLELDGVDCTGVRRIEPFTVAVQTTQAREGGGRIDAILPTKVSFPNLDVVIADNAAAASWQAWVDDFIVHGSGKEKNGAIVLLGADMKAELARIQLQGVGICGFRHSRRETGVDKAATFAAELYCERMTLQVGKPAPAKPGRVIVGPKPVTGIVGPKPIVPITPGG